MSINERSTLSGLTSSNLGYPRIGGNREWKKALERFWQGSINESELHSEMKRLRLEHLSKQRDKGIDRIPVGDFSYYDHVLDTSVMFGLVPERFNYRPTGPVPLSVYFGMARGQKGATASEMTKWMNTNYHYIVPELENAAPVLTENKPLLAYREAKQELGIYGKPVLIGPYSFVVLSKGYDRKDLASIIRTFLPLYARVLSELAAEGVQWVQIDEPVLTTSFPVEDLDIIQEVYEALTQAAPSLNIMLQTYFGSLDHYERLTELPVQGLGLDFVYDDGENLQHISRHGFPKGKTLGAGVIDGRNIWRSDLNAVAALLGQLAEQINAEQLIVQPSCSLLHVPVSLEAEHKLDRELVHALAFADEKLDEIAVLTAALGKHDPSALAKLEQSAEAVARFNSSAARVQTAADLADLLAKEPLSRSVPFAERRIIQQNRLKLPPLPTTTIGSFPQTAEVRKARLHYRKGEWSAEQYRTFIQQQIKEWIDIQEDIGIDVLVHGEFERTDMVEFFGEKLKGFAFTQNGWVQSYGSRCVKPPIIYGDVSFDQPMTVEETAFAQSLTSKPVKGMLTGPVTILNWSFERNDIPRRQVALQLALALRAEVEALEQAGISMIQVDEPAIREGLPLKKEQQQAYLDWAVQAFLVTTATVEPATQIHTHMCYSEFQDMIQSISDMDADVISIETSRSHGELIVSFEDQVYDKGIGLGVYDIHSPRIPDESEMLSMIQRALRVLPADLFWVNPDCGLKTRTKEESVAALRQMVQAAQAARAVLSVSN
ncbi:5-methyltetrahydropteroyltriglutamate--homocysteine S-methyltransferase [Paenibacillus polymyxa]|uniref:5-methyltetrahydropteroyltriglutamate-- homocysteine S-methyltransferase n=1 Tax=Paenibacillus TaxID=44249 RepID=UPI00142DE273|nr:MULTISPECIES: 5-methyltetrahydropteroyltriglutamate--homocysteine S-methyltransferase [Paenibacillus]KAF6656999.1 5-methyltetrahydropteroyltriglutamate--homocysteine S-methyltransferase [Paenibacillus sp. EKM301P]UBS87022.1 5-methyltetrahydropteroyltriglutamate--homocysteine S-methyltransferase [Paenibacillus polymyxa]WHX35599.1 5-methyltetrahydropteroyltriglutamate--homocysteine S-methyltransferase [Paenibacillus polymyxa]